MTPSMSKKIAELAPSAGCLSPDCCQEHSYDFKAGAQAHADLVKGDLEDVRDALEQLTYIAKYYAGTPLISRNLEFITRLANAEAGIDVLKGLIDE